MRLNEDDAVKVDIHTSADAQPDNGPNLPKGKAAKDALAAVIHEAQGLGKAVVSKMADEAMDTTQRLRHQAVSSLDDSKAQLASQIGSVVKALRRSGEQFRSDDLEDLAGGPEWLADQVAQVQTYLHEKSSEALLGELRRALRNRPALVLGGLFVTGVLVARFFQSAGQQGGVRRDTLVSRRAVEASR
jgi:hypothetical protein